MHAFIRRISEECEKPLRNVAAATRKPSSAFILIALFTTVFIFTLQSTNKNDDRPIIPFNPKSDEFASCSGFFKTVPPRKVVKSITEFGGIGDGRTSNTEAFRKAVAHFESFGGGRLNVPAGRWITGSFNLTSNFTLFLEEGATILGSQDAEEWPIIKPLPSYGRGREREGGRHISLIHGNGLNNVIITGNNGSIDGQGKMWWDLWWNKTLNHTRGHLVELIDSHNILIPISLSGIPRFGQFIPFTADMTILAPLTAPNTDGIDPDSSTNVCIEDCYIESGDDLVAVKSGWDQYGIRMSKPSINITIRRVSGTTPTCSGVGIGSEMSGGIANVLVEDMQIRDSAAGVRIKTDKGRGGYITNITIRNMLMERVKVPIRFSRGANDHPDENWDRNALPELRGIVFSNITSVDSRKPPLLQGIEGAPFDEICLKNVSILGISPAKWSCEFVSGFSEGVTPVPCPELQKNGTSSFC